MSRPSTPPRASTAAASAEPPQLSPPTPEATRRIEESRLRAKARRAQHEAATAAAAAATNPGDRPRKRAHDDAFRGAPASSRDGRANGVMSPPAAGAGSSSTNNGGGGTADEIRPARKFAKFVDYDLAGMTDTKGGFLSADDDPWNKAMSGSASAAGTGTTKQHQNEGDGRPAGMGLAEWERLQLLRRLRRQKAGPFEPGLSVLTDEAARRRCRECGAREIDFVWDEVFAVAVCAPCKDRMPERYSLLTKTEVKEDYLLTDPELRDAELLPHLSRPNPHKSHWHDMMLFLRCQVEAYAFGAAKWGSAAALDAEFERRDTDRRRRREAKFRERLLDLKRRTRTDAYRRQHGRLGGGGPSSSSATTKESASSSGPGGRKARFGDALAAGPGAKHVHEWGRPVDKEDGASVKTCASCGMEVEEMEF